MSKECCCTNNHQDHHHNHNHDHAHHHSEEGIKAFAPAIFSFVLLMLGLLLEHYFHAEFLTGWIKLLWYLVAYLPVGLPVLKEAWEGIQKGSFFSEFFLMGIATIGAFILEEYPEGVAVMLFYSIGEVFQGMAVSKARKNIQNLIDQRPDEVTLVTNSEMTIVKAKTVEVGSVIQLKPGGKLALDGELLTERASFNTAALTGESKPDTFQKGDKVLAGMINLNTVCQIKVTAKYQDSKLSKILDLVQNATKHKAPTELFIQKFAKIYTPIVVFLALGITILPYFFVADYQIKDWLYRALVFLVISCPCALVISIPLGYFGGIGAASKNGILVKGSNFLDVLASVQKVVMDKTGTLTEGVFKVQEVNIKEGFSAEDLLAKVNILESHSSHPVATAIHEYVGDGDTSIQLSNIEEIPGMGLRALDAEGELLVRNFKLLEKFQIKEIEPPLATSHTLIAIAYKGFYAGYISIADQVKMNSSKAIYQLNEIKVESIMLSGDKNSVVEAVAKGLGIRHYYGELLPEDKVEKLKALKNEEVKIAFVGDGINDAPVIALSDVGLAMGGLGSDAAIETADVVIQDDDPLKIPMAIAIGKKTKQIVWQNIAFAFGVKALVLILGAGGMATMWEAVFADVGVALLAVLNAVRVLKTRF